MAKEQQMLHSQLVHSKKMFQGLWCGPFSFFSWRKRVRILFGVSFLAFEVFDVISGSSGAGWSGSGAPLATPHTSTQLPTLGSSSDDFRSMPAFAAASYCFYEEQDEKPSNSLSFSPHFCEYKALSCVTLCVCYEKQILWLKRSPHSLFNS